jgi:hypothetical protein
MFRSVLNLATSVTVVVLASVAFAQSQEFHAQDLRSQELHAQVKPVSKESKAPSGPIEDNSFLIEEAYNQEAGVVQHIQTFQFMKDGSALYTFTEEVPVPKETHQVSVTVPVVKLADGPERAQVSDIFLNYRYQLIGNKTLAVAPRFSLLLPTGESQRGFGSGTLGYQVNLPVSVVLNHLFVSHFNLGSTFIPGRKNTEGLKANTVGYNAGASLIYLVTENFNVMCEAVGSSDESVEAEGSTKRSESMFINPGVRFAMNFDSGLQVVPGVSMPIGIGPSAGVYGGYAYLSFEHPLF